jgi:hypothetical protein
VGQTFGTPHSLNDFAASGLAIAPSTRSREGSPQRNAPLVLRCGCPLPCSRSQVFARDRGPDRGLGEEAVNLLFEKHRLNRIP